MPEKFSSRKKYLDVSRNYRTVVTPDLILGTVLLGLILGVTDTAAIAQIVPDNTLGTDRSNLTPDNLIEGGAIRGANLFHSFSEFNVNEGQQINFTNPSGIARILSRVTGNNRSQILGTLGVLGNADLFLINPNGILFGANAKLDVRGSFVASTASSFKFPDGNEFSATNPQAPPLLTINVPTGLQYNGSNAIIQVQGASLQVPSGRTLALVGGDVIANGPQLRTVGGRIELGGLVDPGTVELMSNSDTLQLSFPSGIARGNISLNPGDRFPTDLTVRGATGGSIALNANNIAIAGSMIRSGINPDTGTPNSQGGDITIDATGTVTITDASSILNTVRPGGLGNAGNISITAQSVFLTNGTQLQTSTFGQGNAGNITIQANSVAISGEDKDGFSSGIFSNVQQQGVGHGGNITIEAASLSLGGGAELSSSISGRGDAGTITLQVSGPIVLDGKTSGGFTTNVHSDVFLGAVGRGGNVNITAESLSITGGAEVSVTTAGQGDSGSINIRVQNALLIDGANSVNGIGSGLGAGAVGNGGSIQIDAETVVLSNTGLIQLSTSGQGRVGDLTIQARSLVLNSGGGLQTSAFGQGDAGNIFLNISDIVDLSGTSSLGASSGFFSGTRETARGRGGSINVVTDRLRIADGAVMSARTLNAFRGGDIRVNANSLELIGGGQILATASSSGQAGDIAINAADSILIAGFDPTFNARLAQFGRPIVDPAGAASGVFVSTTGGAAGNIRIRADSLILDNQAEISAETSSNTGGNITLDMPNLLLLRRGSTVSTTAGTAQAGGDGGNIAIDAGFLVAFPTEDSNITADAFTGRGGNIDITTQGLFGLEFRDRQTPLSDITASSQFGINGAVILNTPDIDPIQGAIELPTTFSIPSLARGCQARGSQTSSFVNTGRGGLPTHPTAPLIPDTLWQDLELLGDAEEGGREQPTTHPQGLRTDDSTAPMIEAQGWVVLSDGAIVLTAQAPAVTPDGRENNGSIFCSPW
jgi:filamentous hemagglutinin family protein